MSSSTTSTTDREVSITRLINAPRERVFQAWTDPAQLPLWYAPHGCSISFKKLELREGGAFHSCIRTPDGYHCWCIGVYTKITAPARIVYTMQISNEAGDPITASEAGMDPDWPAETTVTITLEDEAGQTRLTLHQTVAETLAIRTGAQPSWLQMLDRLNEVLSHN